MSAKGGKGGLPGSGAPDCLRKQAISKSRGVVEAGKTGLIPSRHENLIAFASCESPESTIRLRRKELEDTMGDGGQRRTYIYLCVHIYIARFATIVLTRAPFATGEPPSFSANIARPNPRQRQKIRGIVVATGYRYHLAKSPDDPARLIHTRTRTPVSVRWLSS